MDTGDIADKVLVNMNSGKPQSYTEFLKRMHNEENDTQCVAENGKLSAEDDSINIKFVEIKVEGIDDTNELSINENGKDDESTSDLKSVADLTRDPVVRSGAVDEEENGLKDDCHDELVGDASREKIIGLKDDCDELVGDELVGDELVGDELVGDELVGDELVGDASRDKGNGLKHDCDDESVSGNDTNMKNSDNAVQQRLHTRKRHSKETASDISTDVEQRLHTRKRHSKETASDISTDVEWPIRPVAKINIGGQPYILHEWTNEVLTATKACNVQLDPYTRLPKYDSKKHGPYKTQLDFESETAQQVKLRNRAIRGNIFYTCPYCGCRSGDMGIRKNTMQHMLHCKEGSTIETVTADVDKGRVTEEIFFQSKKIKRGRPVIM